MAQLDATAFLSSSSALAGAAGVVFDGSAGLGTSSAVGANLNGIFLEGGQADGVGTLSGGGVLNLGAVSGLLTDSQLSGDLIFLLFAALDTNSVLAGGLTAQFQAMAGLDTDSVLVGALTGQFLATAALTTDSTLAGIMEGDVPVTAALTTDSTIAAAALGPDDPQSHMTTSSTMAAALTAIYDIQVGPSLQTSSFVIGAPIVTKPFVPQIIPEETFEDPFAPLREQQPSDRRDHLKIDTSGEG